ncbi:MAG: hypothetical protein JO031_07895, partial [Ktedonobacteraceae bacterium]|nr:hypothetical protein [Ktedonobacteraceae bacterium]
MNSGPCRYHIKKLHHSYERICERLCAAFLFCCLLLCCISCNLFSTAQSTPTAILQQPAAKLTYVAIGASDTFGIGADDPQTQNWPFDLSTLLGRQV